MDFLAIKTRKFTPPQDKGKLFELLDQYLPKLKEKDVVLVTSKIVAIDQGRFVPTRGGSAAGRKNCRLQLIKQEAEAYYQPNPSSITLKAHTLTPYAGIDRSNANGHYVFWPKAPHQTAKKIWEYLRRKHRIKNLGVIIADSTCHPMRYGHFGISIGFYGFRPVYWYEKQKDIFGRKLVHHCQNLVDALAAIGVIYMGEGPEQTPLLLIRGFPKIEFSAKAHLKEFLVDRQDDLYAPLLGLLKK